MPNGNDQWLATGLITAVCSLLSGLTVLLAMLFREKRKDRAQHTTDKVTLTKSEMDVHAQVVEELHTIIRRQDKRVTDLEHKNQNLTNANIEAIQEATRLNGEVNHLKVQIEEMARESWSSRLDAIVLVDDRGTILEWSPGATALFHYRSKEMIGSRVTEIIPDRYLEVFKQKFGEVVSAKRFPERGPFDVEVLSKEGDEVSVRVILSAWMEDGEMRLCGRMMSR